MILTKPKYIIIHHSLTNDSETVSWNAIRKYHMETLKWSNIGYHYGIETVNKSTEIFVGRFEGHTGAHTKGYNRKSIGICLVGNYDKFWVPEDKWDILLKLVQNIILRYDIGIDDVIGHREVASYKSCPGNLFDMYLFREKLRKSFLKG